MTNILKTLLVSTAVTASAFGVAGVAQAQVAYSDVQAVIQRSAAAKAGSDQIKVTYKPQIDALDSRARTLAAEMNVLVVKFQNDQKANPKNPTLQAQGEAIQAKAQAAEAEIGTIRACLMVQSERECAAQGDRTPGTLGAPLLRAQQYVLEQIDARLDTAVTNAMNLKKVTLLVSREAVIKNMPGTDLTPEIVTELNKLLPTVSVTPPAGWQPGQSRPGAPAAAGTPAKPAPTGR